MSSGITGPSPENGPALTDSQLAELIETVRLQRQIRRAVTAFVAVFGVATVVYGLTFCSDCLLPAGPPVTVEEDDSLMSWMTIAYSIVAVSHLVAALGTWYCRSWAPWLIVAVDLGAVGMILHGASSMEDGARWGLLLPWCVVAVAIAGLIALLAAQAAAAIPQFLKRPVWCQAVAVYCKL